jgi:hypothetical protein
MPQVLCAYGRGPQPGVVNYRKRKSGRRQNSNQSARLQKMAFNPRQLNYAVGSLPAGRNLLSFGPSALSTLNTAWNWNSSDCSSRRIQTP